MIAFLLRHYPVPATSSVKKAILYLYTTHFFRPEENTYLQLNQNECTNNTSPEYLILHFTKSL